MTLQQGGALDEAERLYKSVLATNSDHFEALHFLGLLEAQRKRYVEADRLMRRSLEINAGVAEGFANHARVLNALKRSEEALAACDKALALNRHAVEALVSRGIALYDLRRYREALCAYDQALATKADYTVATRNRINALIALKRYDDALMACDHVLVADPKDRLALICRGNALFGLRRFADALASFDDGLAIDPNDVMALTNRGTALEELKRDAEALASHEAALAIRPDFADALYNRARLLNSRKLYDKALVAYDRARAADPEHAEAYAVIGLALAVCDWGRVERLWAELASRIGAGMPFAPFQLLLLCDDPALHLKCAKNCLGSESTVRDIPIQRRRSPPRSKIRLAYFSYDFRLHPVSYLIAGLIEQHDRDRFDVVGVSFGPDDGSEIRRRIVDAFDEFHDLNTISDPLASVLLKDLKFDLVVDLTGFTTGCRLELLRDRPAPVQASYLGYAGTLAADFIDYVIADAITVPFDQQPFYMEKIVHLPHCYLVNDDRRPIAEQMPSRRDEGLPEDAFVFCCFNGPHKMSKPVFDVWTRLLQGVPDSVLWLRGDGGLAQSNLRREAQARGLNPARLIFATWPTLSEHLARHRLADLFLDTLPFNAHTTASDALWAGLPVLTCRGRAFAGRVAASLLNAVDLPELVTESLAEYEALALRLATDRVQLAAIRAKLARNRSTHPLFDTDLFRRHIEAAYIRMCEIWQRGESPQSFTVEAIKRA